MSSKRIALFLIVDVEDAWKVTELTAFEAGAVAVDAGARLAEERIRRRSPRPEGLTVGELGDFVASWIELAGADCNGPIYRTGEGSLATGPRD